MAHMAGVLVKKKPLQLKKTKATWKIKQQRKDFDSNHRIVRQKKNGDGIAGR